MEQEAVSGERIHHHLEATIKERKSKDYMVLGVAGLDLEILDVEIALELEVLVVLWEGESGAEEVIPGLLCAISKEFGEGSVLGGHLNRTIRDQPRMAGTWQKRETLTVIDTGKL